MIQPTPRLQCKRQVLNCPQSARRWAAVVHRTDHSPQWQACYNESPDNQSHGVQGRRHKTSPKMWLYNGKMIVSLESLQLFYWAEPSKPSPPPSPYHPCPHFGHNVPADSLDTPTPLLPLWCPKRCQQDIDVEGWNPRCKRQEQDRQYNQFHRDHLEC